MYACVELIAIFHPVVQQEGHWELTLFCNNTLTATYIDNNIYKKVETKLQFKQ